LELRRKQFHVLVTAIHELQQILEGLLALLLPVLVQVSSSVQLQTLM